MENIIQTEKVGRAFKTQGDDFWALKEISIEIPKGKLSHIHSHRMSERTACISSSHGKPRYIHHRTATAKANGATTFSIMETSFCIFPVFSACKFR